MSEISKEAARLTANGLSVGRGLAGPALAQYFLITPPEQRTWKHAGVVAGLVATDKIDGYLGRYAEASKLGAWLDQMADKAFVLPPMIALAKNGEIEDHHWKIKLGRDVGVTALRSAVHMNGGSTSAETIGKIKASAEMTGLVMASSPLASEYPELTNRIFDTATTLNVVSGLQYMQSFGAFTIAAIRGEGQEEACEQLIYTLENGVV